MAEDVPQHDLRFTIRALLVLMAFVAVSLGFRPTLIEWFSSVSLSGESRKDSVQMLGI
jgi:hypothetical protein